MNKLIDIIIDTLQNIKKLNISDSEKLAHLTGALAIVDLLIEKETQCQHKQTGKP